jgi:catechol 2,3-dioxygenase-like lactoylglutathione lyase family enzyme
VRDYDEAIGYYVGVLGFRLVEDTPIGPGKRWVVVSPGDGSAEILLARGVGERQTARAGDQTGGRVGFFLDSDDFDRDHAAFTARGVKFIERPRQEAYGKVAVFEDMYGNKWDMVERSG